MGERKTLPISFIPAMVRAERAGLKTQTRRVMKPQPKPTPDDFPGQAGHWWPSNKHQSMLHVEKELQEWTGLAGDVCPYGGSRGDLLYVKEAAWMWCERIPNGTTPTGRAKYRYEPLRSAPIRYVADHPERPALDVVSPDTGNQFGWRYKVARFLPRWASRLTLEITDVRVERLQDISEEDAECEGVTPATPQEQTGARHKPAFRHLWEEINGVDSWVANPWVWVVEFQAHHMNVDRFLEESRND